MWLVSSMLHGGTDVKLSKLSMAPYVEKYANVKLDHLPNFWDENTSQYLSCHHPARLPEKHLQFGGMTGGPQKTHHPNNQTAGGICVEDGGMHLKIFVFTGSMGTYI